MTAAAAGLLAVYVAVLLALAWPLGVVIAGVADGHRLPARLLRAERVLLAWCGVDAGREMDWRTYATAAVVFGALCALAVYGLQRVQAGLPLNPAGLGNITADSAFNTAISFATNTNWQGYGGEATMSYLTQMLGLTVQNFVSAAVGIAVLFALLRGFARQSAGTVGNFWLDVTRATCYVLLPASIVLALFLAAQGVVQTFDPYQEIEVVEAPAAGAEPLSPDPRRQVLPLGPVASQVAIKQLGTNGGGFFNVNSSHPYENPTFATNFAQLLAILLLPAALCVSFGRMVGDARQGRAVLAAMTLVFALAAAATMTFEQQGNPRLTALGIDDAVSTVQPGGNMEGKEARFGIGASALWAVATTAAANGSVNSMHDSYTPLGGLVPMLLMQLGEVIFGGVGSGLYGMLVFALVAVFIAGLMIGRTPEYLGKKIESFEIKMAALVILVPPLLVLVGTAIAVMVEPGRATIHDSGAHGFSEVLYALSSAGNNNGSAFAGLGANTPFYNTLLAIAMWFSRYVPMVAVLAIAGSLAAKPRLAVTSGTLPTHGPLFVLLLIGTVLLVGALTFIPALALGPLVEHLMLWQG